MFAAKNCSGQHGHGISSKNIAYYRRTNTGTQKIIKNSRKEKREILTADELLWTGRRK